MRFTAQGDSTSYPYVVPMSEHPQWKGIVTRLRIDLLDDREPGAAEAGWYGIAGVYLQSVTDKKTSSKVSEFESTTPVKLLLKGNDFNKPGSNDPTVSDEQDAGSSPDVGVNSGCSTVSVTTNNSINALLFLGLGMFALSFVRRRF